MSTSNFVRGSVVKCSFPYVGSPHSPGPHPHFCLYIDSFADDGEVFHVVCYGTSRLDDALVKHHSGAIYSVSSTLIKGSPMSGPVTHFVCSHVAVIPDAWVYKTFSARLDFMRPERRTADRMRQRMYEQFESWESVMEREALTVLNFYRRTGMPGLPGDATLR